MCAALGLTGIGCRKQESPRGAELDAGVMPAMSGSLGPPASQPAPRRGMIWIPAGALVAGTPPDNLPRIADEEIPGEQVMLRGFHIDIYPFPNEEGAIPLTGVSQAEAAGTCAELGKRLCSELEWERACKGPSNHTYEYGDRYKSDRCGTGTAAALRPSGLRVGCSSDYGVFDMHGGVWEWTSSSWGRGSSRPLATVRGGNATAGELVGRCANAMGRPSDSKSSALGFRCCAGPKNEAEVVLNIERFAKLKHRDAVDKALAAKLNELLPEAALKNLGENVEFRVDRLWDWSPVGNEQLIVAGGCAARSSNCGALILRSSLARTSVLGWAESGHYTPAVQSEDGIRDVWVFGQDELGSFKRLVTYGWGTVSVGEKERKLPQASKKKDKKARKER